MKVKAPQTMMSLAAYARYRKVSRQHVSALKRAGALVLKGDWVDVRATDSVLDQSIAVPEGTTLTEARVAELVWRGRLRRLEFEQKAAQLVTIADFENAMAEIIGSARAKLLSVGAALAPLVYKSESAAAAKVVIDTHIRQVLTELAQHEPGKRRED